MKKLIYILFIFSYAIVFSCGCTSKENTDSKNNSEKKEIIYVTTDNWKNYFEFNIEEQLNRNDDGNVESVQYIQSVKLKDNLKEKIRTDIESKVYFSFIQTIDMKTYEIVDPQIGNWKITGNLIHLKMNGANDRGNTRWSSKDENYYSITEFQTFNMYGKLCLEVPGEIKMEKVDGTIYITE